MWTQDDFPGADHVPWQLLIRARSQFEVDAVIASKIVRNVGALTTLAVAAELGNVATKAVALSREANGAAQTESRGSVLAVYGEFDDWCGTMWPHWPGPRPHFDANDPLVVAVADRALELLKTASPELQAGLAPSLEGLAGGRIG